MHAVWCIRTACPLHVRMHMHMYMCIHSHVMLHVCMCMYLQHGGADGVVQVVRRRAQQAVQLELLLGGKHLVRVRVRAGVMVMVRPGWG